MAPPRRTKGFSAKCATAAEYLANAPDTPYIRRIKKGLLRNPNATLAQLRGHPKGREKPLSAMKQRPIWERPWAQLTPVQKNLRRKSRAIYGQLCRAPMLSLSCICKYSPIEITAEEVLNNLGNAFVKKNGRWVTRPNFRNEVVMRVFTDGEEQFVPVADYASSRIIGQYFNRIRNRLQQPTSEWDWGLDAFPPIVDSEGRSIQLESDPMRVLFLLEMSALEDGFSIYGYEVGL